MKKITIFIAYILIVLFALLPKISSIVYKKGCSCQLQIDCHFHFLNFPTVSFLLHIRKILVHWPFLEISDPQKWVVGATLALKENFLAGTLLLSTDQYMHETSLHQELHVILCAKHCGKSHIHDVFSLISFLCFFF